MKKEASMSKNLFDIEDEVLLRYNGEGDEDTLVIPDGVKIIGSLAFRMKNYRFKKIIFPSSLEKIDAGAFNICNDIEEIIGCSNVKTINEFAFRGCSKLREIDIIGNVEIGTGAFLYCNNAVNGENKPLKAGVGTNVNDMIIDRDVLIEYVGDINNTTLVVPEGIRKISYYFFINGNSKLKFSKIILPNTLEEIERFAFSDLKTLEVVEGGKLKKIGKNAFQGCRNLKRITLAENAQIDEKAFQDCLSLADEDGMLIINNNLLAINTDEYFSKHHDSEKMTIVVPDNVKEIDGISINYPFDYLYFVITNNVQRINNAEFYVEGMEFIIVDHDSHKELGRRKFEYNNDFPMSDPNYDSFCNNPMHGII